MKVIIFVVGVLFFAASGSFAETIYLKDGKLLRGRVVEDDGAAVLVESDTEWRRVPHAEIELIKKGDTMPASASSVDANDGSSNARVPSSISRPASSGGEFLVGPKIGYASFSDSGLSSFYGAGPVYGLAGTYWMESVGVQVELQSFMRTGKSRYYSGYGYYSYSEDVAVIPIYVNFLARRQGAVSPYAGIGIGSMSVKVSNNFGGSISSTITAYQVIAGVSARYIGVSVQLSQATSGKDWGKVNFGSSAFIVDFHF